MKVIRISKYCIFISSVTRDAAGKSSLCTIQMYELYYCKVSNKSLQKFLRERVTKKLHKSSHL